MVIHSSYKSDAITKLHAYSSITPYRANISKRSFVKFNAGTPWTSKNFDSKLTVYTWRKKVFVCTSSSKHKFTMWNSHQDWYQENIIMISHYVATFCVAYHLSSVCYKKDVMCFTPTLYISDQERCLTPPPFPYINT